MSETLPGFIATEIIPEQGLNAQQTENRRPNRFKAILAGIALSLTTLQGGTAHAEGPPTIVDINAENTDGYTGGSWRDPDSEVGPDGLPVVAALDINRADPSRQRLGLIKFGNFEGSSGNELNILDDNFDGRHTTADFSVVVRSNNKPVVFAGDKNGSKIYDCFDAACDSFSVFNSDESIKSISAKIPPDGTIAVATSGADNGPTAKHLTVARFDANSLSSPVCRERVNDGADLIHRATGEVDLAAADEIVFTDGTDIKAAFLNDTCGAADADFTAMETEARTEFDLSGLATPDGLRSAHSSQEGGTAQKFTRTAACIDSDCPSSGTVTSEVLMPGGRGNSLQFSANKDILNVSGTFNTEANEDAMALIVCPEKPADEEGGDPTPADCTDVNYVYYLDVADGAAEPSYNLYNGKSVAVYTISNGDDRSLRVVSGLNETFNVNVQQDGQQREANQRAAAGPISPITGLEELPAPLEGARLGRKHDILPGWVAVKACTDLTDDANFCRDTLWDQ